MSLKLGVYDFFTYTLPGFKYLLVFYHLFDNLGLVPSDKRRCRMTQNSGKKTQHSRICDALPYESSRLLVTMRSWTWQ